MGYITTSNATLRSEVAACVPGLQAYHIDVRQSLISLKFIKVKS
jgi:hypothetical protein